MMFSSKLFFSFLRRVCFSVLFCSFLVITSCENFFSGGNDFIEKMRDEVCISEATEINVSVLPVNMSDGRIINNVEATQKVGVPFLIEFEIDSSRGNFWRWAAYLDYNTEKQRQLGDDEVYFSSKNSAKTEVTINKEITNIRIVPEITEHPVVTVKFSDFDASPDRTELPGTIYIDDVPLAGTYTTQKTLISDDIKINRYTVRVKTTNLYTFLGWKIYSKNTGVVYYSSEKKDQIADGIEINESDEDSNRPNSAGISQATLTYSIFKDFGNDLIVEPVFLQYPRANIDKPEGIQEMLCNGSAYTGPINVIPEQDYTITLKTKAGFGFAKWKLYRNVDGEKQYCEIEDLPSLVMTLGEPVISTQSKDYGAVTVSLIFRLNDNLESSVYFEPVLSINPEIYFVNPEHGTISPSGTAYEISGTRFSVSAKADTGYAVMGWVLKNAKGEIIAEIGQKKKNPEDKKLSDYNGKSFILHDESVLSLNNSMFENDWSALSVDFEFENGELLDGCSISAITEVRNSVSSTEPYANKEEVIRTTPIKIRFTKPVSSKVTAENIFDYVIIIQKKDADDIQGVELTTDYFDVEIKNKGYMILFESKNKTESSKWLDSGSTIEVTLSKALTDADDIPLESDYRFSFTLGTQGDITGPILSDGKLWMNPDNRGVQSLKEVPVTAWSDWDEIEPVRIGGKVSNAGSSYFKQFSFNVFADDSKTGNSGVKCYEIIQRLMYSYEGAKLPNQTTAPSEMVFFDKEGEWQNLLGYTKNDFERKMSVPLLADGKPSVVNFDFDSYFEGCDGIYQITLTAQDNLENYSNEPYVYYIVRDTTKAKGQKNAAVISMGGNIENLPNYWTKNEVNEKTSITWSKIELFKDTGSVSNPRTASTTIFWKFGLSASDSLYDGADGCETEWENSDENLSFQIPETYFAEETDYHLYAWVKFRDDVYNETEWCLLPDGDVKIDNTKPKPDFKSLDELMEGATCVPYTDEDGSEKVYYVIPLDYMYIRASDYSSAGIGSAGLTYSFTGKSDGNDHERSADQTGAGSPTPNGIRLEKLDKKQDQRDIYTLKIQDRAGNLYQEDFDIIVECVPPDVVVTDIYDTETLPILLDMGGDIFRFNGSGVSYSYAKENNGSTYYVALDLEKQFFTDNNSVDTEKMAAMKKALGAQEGEDIDINSVITEFSRLKGEYIDSEGNRVSEPVPFDNEVLERQTDITFESDRINVMKKIFGEDYKFKYDDFKTGKSGHKYTNGDVTVEFTVTEEQTGIRENGIEIIGVKVNKALYKYSEEAEWKEIGAEIKDDYSVLKTTANEINGVVNFRVYGDLVSSVNGLTEVEVVVKDFANSSNDTGNIMLRRYIGNVDKIEGYEIENAYGYNNKIYTQEIYLGVHSVDRSIRQERFKLRIPEYDDIPLFYINLGTNYYHHMSSFSNRYYNLDYECMSVGGFGKAAGIWLDGGYDQVGYVFDALGNTAFLGLSETGGNEAVADIPAVTGDFAVDSDDSGWTRENSLWGERNADTRDSGLYKDGITYVAHPKDGVELKAYYHQEKYIFNVKAEAQGQTFESNDRKRLRDGHNKYGSTYIPLVLKDLNNGEGTEYTVSTFNGLEERNQTVIVKADTKGPAVNINNWTRNGNRVSFDLELLEEGANIGLSNGDLLRIDGFRNSNSKLSSPKMEETVTTRFEETYEEEKVNRELSANEYDLTVTGMSRDLTAKGYIEVKNINTDKYYKEEVDYYKDWMYLTDKKYYEENFPGHEIWACNLPSDIRDRFTLCPNNWKTCFEANHNTLKRPGTTKTYMSGSSVNGQQYFWSTVFEHDCYDCLQKDYEDIVHKASFKIEGDLYDDFVIITTKDYFGNTAVYKVSGEGNSTEGSEKISVIDWASVEENSDDFETLGALTKIGDYSNGAEEYTFGVWPQSLKDPGVYIDETHFRVFNDLGGVTYYLGDDGSWYERVYENGNSSSSDISYAGGDKSNVQQLNGHRVLYFKVEPLKWQKMGNTMVCTSAITADIPYYGSVDNRHLGNKLIYANNYKYSNVRAFLNGLENQYVAEGGSRTANDINWNNSGFLQRAFTVNQRNLIAVTTVDNSGESTSDSLAKLPAADGNNAYSKFDFTCENTEDKIFLLSEKEVTDSELKYSEFGNYAPENEMFRTREMTDYALANYVKAAKPGSDYSTAYYLRSPHYKSSSTVRYIETDGYGDCYDKCNIEYYGIVPALNLVEHINP